MAQGTCDMSERNDSSAAPSHAWSHTYTIQVVHNKHTWPYPTPGLAAHALTAALFASPTNLPDSGVRQRMATTEAQEVPPRPIHQAHLKLVALVTVPITLTLTKRWGVLWS